MRHQVQGVLANRPGAESRRVDELVPDACLVQFGEHEPPGSRGFFDDLDRYHLAMDVIDRLPKLGANAAYVKQELRNKLIEHNEYICKYGDDIPEVRDWKWPR